MAENAVTLSLPVELYTMPRQFSTVFNGKIYVGKPDTDPTAEANRITVYHEGESGTLTPIAQPISINAGGYPVIGGQVVKLVVTQDYSIAVYDQLDAQAFYFPRCSGPYVLKVFHDQTLHGDGTEADPLGVQLSGDAGNQLQIRDDGLYYGPVAPDDVINLYISASGSNTATGKRNAPLQTVGEALTRIAALSVSGSYTVFLRAGETFTIDKGYTLGLGNFSISFTYYDDPLFGDVHARYGWWPVADDRLQRPTLVLDTYKLDNGLIAATSIGASPTLENVTFDGLNLVVRSSNGTPTGGGQMVYCGSFTFYGCNVFIEGDMGIGASKTAGFFSSNVYFHGDATLLAGDYSPSVFEMLLVPAGGVNVDPLGEYPDVTGRTANVTEVLRPANIVGGVTYDTKTKTMFGWNVSWDIFANS